MTLDDIGHGGDSCDHGQKIVSNKALRAVDKGQ